MHHWGRITEEVTVDELRYKGLVFPRFSGGLTQEQRNARCPFYAYFGGSAMTAQAIRYRVDIMIRRGVYVEQPT